jgi:hypothetical protein
MLDDLEVGDALNGVKKIELKPVFALMKIKDDIMAERSIARSEYPSSTKTERLILGFGVLDLVSGDQCVNQGAQECLAPLAGVMNELEEPEVDGEFLLRNAAMRAQPGAQQ